MSASVAVIVQCRLASTRLPEKALLPLAGKPLFAWALRAMKRVPADAYVAAVGEGSYERLAPVARAEGFECVAGPEDDVLRRFCLALRACGADIAVRATADNPFLFYEAAAASAEAARETGADYFTYTGLPHGSGVEAMSARALFRADSAGADAFEREHVGPALYRHGDAFDCRFEAAPPAWAFPALRTTVDTAADYRRASRIARALVKRHGSRAYCAEEILAACALPEVARPVLLAPSLRKGRGTGHLARMLALALESGADVFMPERASGGERLAEAGALAAAALARGLDPAQIVRAPPEAGEYALIVSDAFALTEEDARRFAAAAPLAALDEGGACTDYCDYLADSIPPLQDGRRVNQAERALMALPRARRGADSPGAGAALAVFGGEDPAGLALKAALRLWREGNTVTAVVHNPEAEAALLPPEARGGIRLTGPIENLREHLWEYGTVVTHYGLTAWEARAAGCRVLLAATTPLHGSLARKHGFEEITL